MLNGLDLFSGIGGLTIALGEWVRPIAYCEQDRYCQAVLMSRMSAGDLPRAPIWGDVRTLRREMFPKGSIDIVYGGFPCQPYSSASRGRRPPCKLRKEIARIVNELQPAVVFAENTSLEAVQGLAELLVHYETTITSNIAAKVGRPFIGRRYWLAAKTNRDGKSAITVYEEMGIVSSPSEVIWEDATPENIRVDDGLPFRVDRLRGLGNAVVPAQAKEAFRRLLGI